MKKNIYFFILSVLSTVGIFLEKNINSYDIYFALIFIGIYVLFKKFDYSKLSKKSIIINITLALIFSFIIVQGNIVYKSLYDKNISVVNEFLEIKSVFTFLFNVPFIFIIMCYLMVFLLNNNIYKKGDYTLSSKKVFLCCFLIIFVCWLPYFLSNYPGSISNDSVSQIEMVIDNLHNISNHHPVIHTLFIFIFYKIGFLFTGEITASIAFVTVVQMLLMALIFSSLITFLYKKNVKKSILVIILMFYSLLPVFGFYSITMWKDVLFAGIFVLFNVIILKLLENDFSNKNLILFVIISLLLVFFRNNAIYMYYIFVITSLMIFRKKIKKILPCLLCVVVIYHITVGPLFNILNIKKSSSSEYISIPLQQVARIAYKNGDISSYEKNLIDKIIPIETIKQVYNPLIVDDIKFNKNYNNEQLNKHKIEYLKIWLSLIKKNKSIAYESYLCSTLGYWYPNVNYWSVHNEVVDNKYNIKVKNFLPNFISNGIKKLQSKSIPIISLEWSIGLIFWCILIIFCIMIIKNQKKNLLIFIPSIGIWLTMMAATPVFAEYRYIFCVFANLPIIILSPFLLDKCNIGKEDVL